MATCYHYAILQNNMNFDALKSALIERQRHKQNKRSHVLEFIQNKAAKSDFIKWLNANYQQQFAEDTDWDTLVAKVRSNDAVHTSSLHNYASTLTDEEDVTKLLKDIEKETTKAEEVVSELYDAANVKKLQPIVGGACLLGGLILIIVTLGLATGFVEVGPSAITNYVAAICGVYGILTMLSGILLILE